MRAATIIRKSLSFPKRLHHRVSKGIRNQTRRLATSTAIETTIPESMRAVVVTPPEGVDEKGRPRRPSPDALTLSSTVPTPKVGPEEVLIKVEAAGINRPDVLQRMGLYPPPPGHSDILGLEVAGTIVAVGDKVPPGSIQSSPSSSYLEIGARVLALANGGGYSEYCAVPYGQCLPIPENMNMITAGCVAETYFTVWHNLFQQSNIFGEHLQRGDSILIHGGTSGIGSTAIQMAKAFDITVYASAGSQEKCKACLDFGAERWPWRASSSPSIMLFYLLHRCRRRFKEAINYKTEDFVERINELTGGKGVNLVLDMVSGPYLPKNLEVLAVGGRLAIIGSLGGVRSEINMRNVMRRRLTIAGSTLRARNSVVKASIASELREHVWPLLEDETMKIRIDTVFDMSEASKAHRLMESNAHIGKIALTWQHL